MAFLLILTMPYTIAFWLALGAIGTFVVFTGASASLVRAGIMGALALVAEHQGRTYRMQNALVCAAAVMAMHDPTVVRFDISFQLSFLATLGLVATAPRLLRFWELMAISLRRRMGHFVLSDGIPGKFQKILAETLAAQIMVTPLLLYYFGTFSLVSPWANVAVLATIPYAMGMGFAASLAGFVGDAFGRAIGWGAWLILEYEMRAIEFFGGLPFAAVAFQGFREGMLIISYGALVLIFWRTRRAKRVV